MAQRLVGRASEMASLERFIERVGDGPCSLLLTGDEGVGKSTLWKEGLAIALQQGVRVLACRSAASEVSLAFTALADLFDSVYEEIAADLPSPQRSALAVALLREDRDALAFDQGAVARAVLQAIRVLAASRPVVLAVDDAQWLDVSSVRVLRFVIRRLEDEPVGVLVSARYQGSEERGPEGWELHTCVPEERIGIIEVGPLSVDALDEIVRSRLGSGLLHPTLVQLHRASGGNPMFALEMARALGRGTTPFTPGGVIPVPDSLRGFVRDRLHAMSPDVARALVVVSALRRPTADLLRAVLPEGDDASSALLEAIQAGVVELEGDAIRFTHPLLASLVYADASGEERRQLHRQLSLVVTDSEERARHMALGANGPDATVAASLDAAAVEARRRGAPDAAAELGELARRLTPPEQQEEAVRRSIAAAESYAIAGDAAQAYRMIRERSRALLDTVARSWRPARGREPMLRRIASLDWDDGDWGDAASELFVESLRLSPGPALRAACERGLTWTELATGNVGQAAVHARSALLLSERLDDRTALAETLSAIALIELSHAGGMVSDVLTRATALQLGESEAPAIRRPSWVLAVLLKWTGELEGSRSRLEALRALILERGDVEPLPGLLLHLSEVEWRVGAWPAAAGHAAEGRDAALRAGDEAMAAALFGMEALVYANTGAFGSAEVKAQEGRVLGDRAGGGLGRILSDWVLALVAFLRDRPVEAHDRLASFGTEAATLGIGEPLGLRFLADEVDARLAAGDLDQASAALARIDAGRRGLGGAWFEAAAHRCAALLDAARGELGSSATGLDSMIEAHERLGEPFELGRSLLVAGTIHRRVKDKRRARRELERAAEIFGELGAVPWAQKARAELGRIGGRAPSRWELTGAELRLARLVAEGRTNREIADALFITVNTVESTLRGVYRKMEVRSRTELAVKIATHQGADGTNAEEVPLPHDRPDP